MTSPAPERFSWQDLALVPAVPGLYAWYLEVGLRPADLHDFPTSREHLTRLAQRLRLPQLRVDAKSHLALRFSGALDHDHLSSGDSGFTALIETTLADETRRRVFADILARATPALTSPLYIGVATNLNTRIQTHSQMIERLSDFDPKDDPAYSFAREVVHRQIPQRKLVVYILPLEGDDVPLEREVAEAAESLLNRMFFPILGRR
jgi:hypothetical protein